MAHDHQHNDRTFRAEDAHKLDNPDRLKWLPAAEVLEAAGLKPGMVVADVGAGTGYFAIPAAERVGPSGRVIAIDLQPEMLQILAERLQGKALPVTPMQGTADSTGLGDGSVDMVLLANVWHEVDDRAGAAREARRVLREGGKVVIVDWRDDATPPPGPPKDHRLDAAAVEAELRESGWAISGSQHVGQFHYLVTAQPR